MSSASLSRGARLSTHDLAVAGVFGALAIVLAFTPLGLIPVPNPSEAATSLHLPAIIAGILSGPIVGALVGLVLAISTWYLYSTAFITFAGGNLLVALAAAFLPRLLIGVTAYYAFRPLRKWPALAAAVAGLVGTLTNTFGVLGILIFLGTLPVALLAPVFSMNVPIEVALALVVDHPHRCRPAGYGERPRRRPARLIPLPASRFTLHVSRFTLHVSRFTFHDEPPVHPDPPPGAHLHR